MLSPDGRCKTFDAAANGYVRGEGAGMLLLKPLERALVDGDRIYGVIRGGAVNHGGRARTITSPNPFAQAQVIQEALTRAGVSAETITYVETHGTGTPLGDPIEINGLKRAFRSHRGASAPDDVAPFCGLGAVKTNIGHLEAGAGIAGVIKVLLAMQHRLLPPIHGLEQPNPRIRLEGSPFYFVRETRPWNRRCDEKGEWIPRRAGVSSFGFGGANAHLILEEASRPTASRGRDTPEFKGQPYLLPLSAKTPAALRELAGRYLHWFDRNPHAAMTDVGRPRHFGFVAQRSALLQSLRLRENIEVPLWLAGKSRDEVAARCDVVLRAVNLLHRRDYPVSVLSGGEAQRAAIARAIALNPPILLCDEPTASVDSHTGRQIMTMLRTLVDERCTSIVLVTHDERLLSFVDRVYEMSDGKVRQGIIPNWVPSALTSSGIDQYE